MLCLHLIQLSLRVMAGGMQKSHTLDHFMDEIIFAFKPADTFPVCESAGTGLTALLTGRSRDVQCSDIVLSSTLGSAQERLLPRGRLHAKTCGWQKKNN